jgi:hypothetical protein
MFSDSIGLVDFGRWMMGNGQIGGNGSVEWIFVHHNALTGLPEDLHQRTTAKGGDNSRDNGIELIDNDKRVRGHDPIEFVDIGGRPGLTPGHFVVTLSFASSDEADNALASIVRRGDSLVILVPAVNRDAHNSGNKGRAKEIRIDW